MFHTFRDWLSSQEESSAFTRLRRDAALGLKPPIPPASINSRSTASPFETEKLSKEKCHCKGKETCSKCKDKNKDDFFDESKAPVVKNTKIDSFLNAVGALKDDTKRLKDDMRLKKVKPKEKDEKAVAKKNVESDAEDEAEKGDLKSDKKGEKPEPKEKKITPFSQFCKDKK